MSVFLSPITIRILEPTQNRLTAQAVLGDTADALKVSPVEARDLAAWSDYPLSMTLRPGPNVSTTPNPDKKFWRGLGYALLIEAALFVLGTALYLLALAVRKAVI